VFFDTANNDLDRTIVAFSRYQGDKKHIPAAHNRIQSLLQDTLNFRSAERRSAAVGREDAICGGWYCTWKLHGTVGKSFS